jgi:hypothetical protein
LNVVAGNSNPAARSSSIDRLLKPIHPTTLMKTPDINLKHTEYLPATDHKIIASHVPVPPIDLDFVVLRQQVHAIKHFVDTVEESLRGGDLALFEKGPGSDAVPTAELHAHFDALRQIGRPDSRHYKLALPCQLFLEEAKCLGFAPFYGQLDDGSQVHLESSHMGGSALFSAFLALIGGITDHLGSDEYLAQLEYEREAFRRDQNAARRFARSIVGQFRSLLAVQVTLGFRHVVAQTVTPEQARAALRDLLRNARTQRLFESIVGYLWQLQDHPSRGAQIQLIVLFDGDQITKGVGLASSLGVLWDDVVTSGKGTHLNGGARDDMHLSPGVRTIDDAPRRTKFIEFVAGFRSRSWSPLLSAGANFGFGRIQADRIDGSPPTKGFLAELD